ncbi:MAG: hypothetical protein IT177_04260 [Acidobacteria bacterium]|nr:hypothetical protein [Acidobacteriota bacterium]
MAEKLGLTTEAFRQWVRQAERDACGQPGLTSDDWQWLKQLEHANSELRVWNVHQRVYGPQPASAFVKRTRLPCKRASDVLLASSSVLTPPSAQTYGAEGS